MNRRERFTREAAAAKRCASTLRRLAGHYREWGGKHIAEAERLEASAAWHEARAAMWEAA